MVILGRVSTRRSAIAANGNVGVVATSAASHDPLRESRQRSQISDFQPLQNNYRSESAKSHNYTPTPPSDYCYCELGLKKIKFELNSYTDRYRVWICKSHIDINFWIWKYTSSSKNKMSTNVNKQPSHVWCPWFESFILHCS